MNKLTTAMKPSLCALVLGAGVAAQAAPLVITNITMVGATPQFAVLSDLGVTNQIQCSTNLSQTNWVVLTNLLVAQSPYWFGDVAAPPASQRFYRVAALAASTPTPSGMVLIPAGSFTMGDTLGDDTSQFHDETPTHMVNVSAFYMDTNLVSYTLWTNVYQWATNHGYSFDNAGLGKVTNHPVQTVDWYDVVKWCNARSEMGGLIPCYYTDASQATVYRSGTNDLANTFVSWAANGYRLPTEAEWEKAARGGLSGQRFPWGITISETQANYAGYIAGSDYLGQPGYSYDLGPNGYNAAFTNGVTPYTSPVGYFAPNGFGLYDMAGNVWEWCWDWYNSGYYSSAPGTDPRGPASSSMPMDFRVFRGGGWVESANCARCAYRGGCPPTGASFEFSVRCVRGL